MSDLDAENKMLIRRINRLEGMLGHAHDVLMEYDKYDALDVHFLVEDIEEVLDAKEGKR